MAAAVREASPEAVVMELPLADGGEGTLDVLAAALGAQVHSETVSDPLGRPVEARFGVWGETAIIEVAQACGLSLLEPAERNPLNTSSQGVGELLLAAHGLGCRHFLVGLGGSATCDGGTGMLAALGINNLKDSSFELLCDVDAPFVGPRGAARVFAPQKGASPADVEVLEERMRSLAAEWFRSTGIQVADTPGAGAAGGLAGAFMAHLDATVVSGIRRVLDLVRFREASAGAHLIITGEGRSDAQTLQGKVPYGVLQIADSIPVALVSGRIEDREALSRAGFSYLVEATPRDLPLAQALDPQIAESLLYQAVQRLL